MFRCSKVLTLVGGLVLLGTLAACGGAGLKVEPIPLTANPIEQINSLADDLGKARNKQLNVLAPSWFGKAEKSLVDAQRGLESGDSVSELLQKAAYGRAHLQRAEEAAEVVHTALDDVLKARELARSAGATAFGEAYAEVEEDFLDLTRAIEDNNLSKARKNKVGVINAFDQLELRAIKERTLGEVRRLMDEAQRNGADRIAPGTYAAAEQSLQEADSFITEQRYQREEMQKKAEEALFQARRLTQVAAQGEKVKTMPPEQIVLWTEEILQKTTAKLRARDMRDESFAVQIQNILGSITALQEDQRYLSQKVKEQQAQIEGQAQDIFALEGKTREEQVAKDRLAAEKRFQELFTEVQGFFSPREAEVYKQGQNLVIRLKAMKFPVGKDVIMPDNYALLSKVRQAIRTFGFPRVVIEGHTDSTGTDAVNLHLSQKRAEAVRKYFIANETLSENEISAVGYGSDRPLASNQTSEGRAINRRIDVVVKP